MGVVVKGKEEKKTLQPKKSAKRWQDLQEDNEPAPLESMWPSVSVSNKNYESDEEESLPKATSFWPSRQKAEIESTEAASYMPSRQKEKQKEDDSSLSSMWPSRQNEEQKEEESSLSSMWRSKNKNNNQKKNKKLVVLEKYSDDNEDDDGAEIDWLNLPVNKPVIAKKEKPFQKQNFMP